ncbi:hypothetical protein PR202_gb09386 [Eleusine coracana subsp. coracana]|uniref:Sulfotransferase n=1 Tax=Eleusine coracana subsp. coracana TaxID=191504 RepID=A0AAV5EHV2_ELECO|nr:hypothetical protein QOZ80_2BG0196730 [Eleusine coracana subsp. coracana]GJN21865.1 hypothetical protein PR202_gb09386 [Eleusine coracana subsp. coracana]
MDITASAIAKYEALAPSLPRFDSNGGATRRKHGGFWYPEHLLAPTLAARDTFAARPTDVILATMPKAGTTWLKALAFAVTRRRLHAPDDPRHPLLGASPHDLVPFLHTIYEEHRAVPAGPRLDAMPAPRVLAVHAPFSALPASVSVSKCRVVYLCRDPKDAVVSFWHYLRKITPAGPSSVGPISQAVDQCCDGVWPFGPVWDHMAEYWRASVERPEEVMFLRYEDLKLDGAGTVARLAAFLGCPFSDEEAARGVPEAVVALCSMDRLRNVHANRGGVHGVGFSVFNNSAFFRKGEVGDWKDHMTPEMARRLDNVVEEKLRGYGISLMITKN